MAGGGVDLRVGHATLVKLGADGVVEGVRRPDPFHLWPTLGFAKLATRLEPQQIAVCVVGLLTEPGFDKAGFESSLDRLGRLGDHIPIFVRRPVLDDLARDILEPGPEGGRDRYDRPPLLRLCFTRHEEVDEVVPNLLVGIELEDRLTTTVRAEHDHHEEVDMPTPGKSTRGFKDPGDLLSCVDQALRSGLVLISDVRDEQGRRNDLALPRVS